MTLNIPRHVPVAGYEGLYEILEDGRVWSLRSRKFLKVKKTKDKYCHVSLCGDKKTTPNIHRLVGLHFIRSSDPVIIREVDHRDRNMHNNVVDNLRWLTASENSQNKTLSKLNTSGSAGVEFNKQANRWRAHWQVNKKRRCKSFINKQEAIDHRAKMEKLHYVERD